MMSMVPALNCDCKILAGMPAQDIALSETALPEWSGGQLTQELG